MTNSSRYNESLAFEAFIQVNKVTGSTIFHCQKRTALRRRDRLKYPTLQNRNIYLFCAHVACFLSVCFVRQTVRKSIAMNVRKPKGIRLTIFKVYVNVER